ncbi:ATP-binding protein [uncultured Draconibacterium sp.]|uniref:ATP-binding protein n=1 Tax=uncultured Draconibacterium sp. TaxID=1573823 RepID=UPI0029C64C47|nr:ATP-binding protein [uncultured Draconibacterium sp.]
MSELKINEQSIRTELKSYKDNAYRCLFEYLWNSFDAGATRIDINFDLPKEGIGYVNNVRIIDNGNGWDFDNNLNTETFLASTKSQTSSSDKTLPKGKFGRGRYAFIWVAEKIEILSYNQKITLEHSTQIDKETIAQPIRGTEIRFLGIYTNLSDSLIKSEDLKEQLLYEFGWFLTENEKYKIFINGVELDITGMIKEQRVIETDEFPDNIRQHLDCKISAKIIVWEKKPSEYSKFYFLDENNLEIFKQNTGLNKKRDDFWHSVYIASSLFQNNHSIKDENDNNEQTTLELGERKLKKTQRRVIQYLKQELTNMRKPYLVIQSEYVLEELKEDKIIPELTQFGIYDEQSFDDLIKTIYTITPSLFTGKGNAEKRFICSTFAGLLSTQDDILIKIILEQLQELTEDEKKDLLDILNRTTLTNVVKTIKEIDHRLEVLDKLKILISEYEKETLEVKHLQKILDENFWIFGEQFRLFSTTEGALKNVLVKYAKEILEIKDPELTTQPNGEVDLFLTKSEAFAENKHKNIVVELKRASKKLTENVEYKQINDYRKKILEQNLCNGENQYWEFYLIGKNYDTGISELIENSKQHGEKEKGLTLCIKDGRVKIFVRKWSDILEVEWGIKMKYLREKLEIQSKKQPNSSPEKIVSNLISEN